MGSGEKYISLEGVGVEKMVAEGLSLEGVSESPKATRVKARVGVAVRVTKKAEGGANTRAGDLPKNPAPNS